MWDCVPELRVLYRHPGETPDEYRDHLARFGPHDRASRVALPAAASAAVGEPLDDVPAEGVNVVGYLDAEDGVGAVARLADRHLARRRRSVRHRGERRHGQPPGRARTPTGDKAVYDLTDRVHQRRRAAATSATAWATDLHAAGPIAGIWAWEVEDFPAWMAVSEALVDEVWTYSEHSAAAIRAAVSCPVFVVPPPIAEVAPPRLSRADLHLPEGYLFLFCFDANSVFERKNPLAVVDAFRRRVPARRGTAAGREGGERRPRTASTSPGCGRRPPTGPTSPCAPTRSRPSASSRSWRRPTPTCRCTGPRATA